MTDIVSQRQTYILVADDTGLYPSENVFPSDELFPRGPGVVEITNIVAGSLKLNEKIADKIPQFGQMYASKFECKVYLTDDLKGKAIQVYQMNDGVYRAVFTGQIDSCKLDKVGTDRTIVAYDLAYTKGQMNVAEWWTEFWRTRETATLKQARDSMLDWAEITYEDVSLPNDSITITKTVDITTCTLTAMLRMMCELSYCFPHFDRTGELKFIFLNTDPEETVDLTDRYEWAKSTFEDFITTDIDGVQFYDSGNQLKWTVGETSNAYPIKKNIFLYEKGTTLLNQIGNEILDYLKELAYTPSKVKMIVSDWDLHLGDWVHTEKGDFYVLSNTYSGSQLFEQTVEAKGQELLYGGTPHLNYGELVLDEKIARVNFTIEQFQIEYGNFKDQTNAKFTITDQQISTEVSRASAAEGNLSSRITQNANSITTKVSKGTVSSEISQEAGQITIKSNRLQIDSTNFKLSTDGTITATNANLSGTLTAGSDTTGTKKKIIIKDGTITGYNAGSQQAQLEIGNGLFNIKGKLALNGYVGVSGDTSFVKDVSFQETSLGNVITAFTSINFGSISDVSLSQGTSYQGVNVTCSGSFSGTCSIMGAGSGTCSGYVTVSGSGSVAVPTYSLRVTRTSSQVLSNAQGNRLSYVKTIKGSMGTISSKYGIIQTIT